MRLRTTMPSLRGHAAAATAALLALTGIGAVALASPAQADGPTTFTSSSAITAASPAVAGQVQPATPYPSSIEVTGMTGSISDVSLRLNGLTHDFVTDLDVLLVAPGGETNMIVMSDVDDETFGLSASVVDITIADGGADFPTSGVLPPGTYAPTNAGAGGDSFPEPAPTPGAATSFTSAFSGLDPNGTWSLYVVDDSTGDDGAIVDGWGLTITTSDTLIATTITASVSPDSVLTGDSLTATAQVTTTDGTPVTEGTVSFVVDGTPRVGYELDDDGVATATFQTFGEGTFPWTVTYEGTDTYLTSSTTTQHVADDPTVVTGNLYCNPANAPLQLPEAGTPQTYPLRVFVEDLAGAVTDAKVHLQGLSHTSTGDLDIMLVAPDGSSLMVLSDVAGSVNDVDLEFADDGEVLTSLIGPGTFVPTNLPGGAHDGFPAPAPAPSTASTFAEAFAGTPAAGTWSLYIVDNAPVDGGYLAVGSTTEWCLELTASAASAITLDAPASVSAGDDAEITATVTSEGEPVTEGTVTYTLDGGDPVTAGTPNADGESTFTVPGLARGSHTITASYTGAGGIGDSVSEPVTVLAQSATSVTAGTTSVIGVGDDLQVTAQVAAADGPVNAGTMSYSLDGGAQVPIGSPDGNGAIGFTIEGLGRGSHTISVSYTGADGWTDSTSPTLTMRVTEGTTVTIDAPATVTVGADATITATITGSSGDPVSAGTALYSLNGGGLIAVGTPNADGEVTFTLTGLTRGTHSIEVVYDGASGWTDSSAEVELLVQQGTIIVLDAPTSVSTGDDVSVTATVTSDGDPVTAGSVTYTVDGGAPVAAGTPTADGTLTFTIPDIVRGSHTITATFTGTDDIADATAAPVTVLAQSPTTTTVSGTIPPGGDLEVTATVTAPDGPVTAGVVEFQVDGAPAATVTVASDGTATWTPPWPAGDRRTVTAAYTGAEGWLDSTSAPTQVGDGTPTSIGASTASFVNVGEAATVAVRVTGAGGVVNSGTVSYSLDGGPVVEVGTPVAGEITLTTPPLTLGEHVIMVGYTGAGRWLDSGPLPVQMEAVAATETTVTSPATVEAGEPFEVTALVSSTIAPVDAGSVTLVVDGTPLPTPAAPGADGTVTFTVPGLSAGPHLVLASYSGTGGWLDSVSGSTEVLAVEMVVSAGGPYAIAEGEPVTLTADSPSSAATIGWDLDGDGDFSDATGTEVTLTWAELESFGIDDGPLTYDIAAQASLEGLVATAVGEIEVSNTGPGAIVDGPRTAVVGQPITLKVSADDPSSADMADLFTYLVDWGDGSPVVEVVGPADPPVTHTYTEAGSYQATFAVVDRDGGQGGDLVITVEATPAPTEPPTEQPTDPTEQPTSPTEQPSDADAPPSLPGTGLDGLDAAAALAALLLAAGAMLVIRRRSAARR